MWKAALVGAFALATIGTSGLAAEEATWPTGQASAQAVAVVTHSDIARLKAALRLTPEQERYWPPIDAALRSVAAQQSSDPEAAGVLARIKRRVLSVALTSRAMQRLASAAMPLIQRLDETQKRDGMRVAQSLGMGRIASAF